MEDGSKRVIRIATDYEAGALWDGGLVDPSAYGLSAAIIARLDAWQAHFDDHYDWRSGWDSQASADAWFDRAPSLRDDVAGEVEDFADVVLDLDEWPERNVDRA